MGSFTPNVKQTPRSDRDPTLVYSVEISEVVNGEEKFKTLGLGGEPWIFATDDELLEGIANRFGGFFKPGDTILWDHEAYADIASAMVHIRANPMAQWEEDQEFEPKR